MSATGRPSANPEPFGEGKPMSLGIVLGFFVLAALGMPLAFALGVVALGAVAASGIEFNMLPQRMMHAVNSFPLMSIPFFMLAGELMIKAGMMERLIDLANAVVGRVRGGLAHVTMLSAAGLSTVSGAAVVRRERAGQHLMPPLRKVYGPGSPPRSSPPPATSARSSRRRAR